MQMVSPVKVVVLVALMDGADGRRLSAGRRLSINTSSPATDGVVSRAGPGLPGSAAPRPALGRGRRGRGGRLPAAESRRRRLTRQQVMTTPVKARPRRHPTSAGAPPGHDEPEIDVDFRARRLRRDIFRSRLT